MNTFIFVEHTARLMRRQLLSSETQYLLRHIRVHVRKIWPGVHASFQVNFISSVNYSFVAKWVFFSLTVIQSIFFVSLDKEYMDQVDADDIMCNDPPSPIFEGFPLFERKLCLN
jgi:hypothetical protein